MSASLKWIAVGGVALGLGLWWIGRDKPASSSGAAKAPEAPASVPPPIPQKSSGGGPIDMSKYGALNADGLWQVSAETLKTLRPIAADHDYRTWAQSADFEYIASPDPNYPPTDNAGTPLFNSLAAHAAAGDRVLLEYNALDSLMAGVSTGALRIVPAGVLLSPAAHEYVLA